MLYALIYHSQYIFVNYFRFLKFVHLVLEKYVQDPDGNVSTIFQDAVKKFKAPRRFGKQQKVCIYLSLPFFFASVPIQSNLLLILYIYIYIYIC
jgi:hypothetical protein